MFPSIKTRRLVIRSFSDEDIGAFHARRNDPEVAKYQDWSLPYSMDAAMQVVAAAAAMDGPTDGEWWMAAVSDRASGSVVGDLAVELTWEGRTAEVGFTFERESWGHGFAVEALEALIEYLFEGLEVARVFGMLHPDNPASAMVLERCGLDFEGHTKSSFWLDGECSDDWIYGITRSSWGIWRDRTQSAPREVRLVDVSSDNERAVGRLVTHKSQERFVSSVILSFGDALFPEIVNGSPLVPWMRAVEADGELVGFVMVAETTDDHPEPYLWRFVIDRVHQRRGIGDRALQLVIDDRRAKGDLTLMTSWTEGKGSPRPFYIRHGFEPTGNIVDDETEARLVFG